MNTTPQRPTIGRIVHFCPAYAVDGIEPNASAIDNPAVIRAALVVGVVEVDGVNWPILRVFGDGSAEDFTVSCAPGRYEQAGVPMAEKPTMGCWSWPPRV